MKRTEASKPMGSEGLAAWLLRRWRTGQRNRPRLELLERITLAPRQSLALVEAEGRRFLIATSPEGAPAFYALDESAARAGVKQAGGRKLPLAPQAARVSW